MTSETVYKKLLEASYKCPCLTGLVRGFVFKIMKKILAQGSWWTINKAVTKELGSLEASLVLTILCDMHQMHPEVEMVWCKRDYIEAQTGLNQNRIYKALNLLEKKNFIYREREKGTIQPKMMYKVLDGSITSLNRVDIQPTKQSYTNSRNNNILHEENKEMNNIDEINNNNNISNISELQREKNKAFRVDVDMNYINETLNSI